jgi:hypothetical protein
MSTTPLQNGSKDSRLWNMLLHEEWLEAAAFLKSSETSSEEKARAVNYINTDGCSTLLLAALHGAHLSLIKQILKIGDIDVLLKGTAGSGWTPLIIACDRYDHSQVGKDHLDFIKLLIQVGGKDLVCRVDGSLRYVFFKSLVVMCWKVGTCILSCLRQQVGTFHFITIIHSFSQLSFKCMRQNGTPLGM